MIRRLMGQALSALFTETQEKIPEGVSQRPRWEWFTKEVIRGNGSGQKIPMLTRYRLVKTPRGSFFVHHWHRPDSDRDCHDHPWWFGGVVLRGGYTEERRENPGKWCSTTTRVQHRRFRWHTMPLDVAHRVISIEPNTWTLVLVGPKVQSWGFYVHDRGQVVAGRLLRPEEHGIVLPPGNEWDVYQLKDAAPEYVPWQTYIAQGGNPDPFSVA